MIAKSKQQPTVSIPASEQLGPDDIVFGPDEMRLVSIETAWTATQMLDQNGIFYLKDVAAKLRLSSAEFKKRALDLEQEDQCSWEIMGIRKAWTHWIVRMKIFRGYYRSNQHPFVNRIEKDWNANQMLARKGYFYLKEVCSKIPFNAQQIRYQTRRNSKSRREFGVWKDPKYKTYVVDMEVFSAWIKHMWQSK